ncbi:basic salivary proline-rich protein 2-like [Cervus elaphus]|uniref:basic salivary proline-rich protein 2-like n=1 Tax=Cervus elaphus TaxID=9860 RepID=UPI001CC2F6A9|nr:basic salivary proline-rich protein 2-like [Cervus elaphus]
MVVPRGQDRAKGPQAAQRCFPPGLKPPLPSARPVPGPQNRAPQAEVSLAPSGFEPPSLGAPGDPSLPPSSRGAHSACLSQRPLFHKVASHLGCRACRPDPGRGVTSAASRFRTSTSHFLPVLRAGRPAPPSGSHSPSTLSTAPGGHPQEPGALRSWEPGRGPTERGPLRICTALPWGLHTPSPVRERLLRAGGDGDGVHAGGRGSGASPPPPAGADPRRGGGASAHLRVEDRGREAIPRQVCGGGKRGREPRDRPRRSGALRGIQGPPPEGERELHVRDAPHCRPGSSRADRCHCPAPPRAAPLGPGPQQVPGQCGFGDLSSELCSRLLDPLRQGDGQTEAAGGPGGGGRPGGHVLRRPLPKHLIQHQAAPSSPGSPGNLEPPPEPPSSPLEPRGPVLRSSTEVTQEHQSLRPTGQPRLPPDALDKVVGVSATDDQAG